MSAANKMSDKEDSFSSCGFCPQCGKQGVLRERRFNGNDRCVAGHVYPSSKATAKPMPVCPTCGCQVFDPFAGKTMIHDVAGCRGVKRGC